MNKNKKKNKNKNSQKLLESSLSKIFSNKVDNVAILNNGNELVPEKSVDHDSLNKTEMELHKENTPNLETIKKLDQATYEDLEVNNKKDALNLNSNNEIIENVEGDKKEIIINTNNFNEENNSYKSELNNPITENEQNLKPCEVLMIVDSENSLSQNHDSNIINIDDPKKKNFETKESEKQESYIEFLGRKEIKENIVIDKIENKSIEKESKGVINHDVIDESEKVLKANDNSNLNIIEYSTQEFSSEIDNLELNSIIKSTERKKELEQVTENQLVKNKNTESETINKEENERDSSINVQMLTSNISDKPMVNIPQESISLEISDKETITNIKSDDINLNSTSKKHKIDSSTDQLKIYNSVENQEEILSEPNKTKNIENINAENSNINQNYEIKNAQNSVENKDKEIKTEISCDLNKHSFQIKEQLEIENFNDQEIFINETVELPIKENNCINVKEESPQTDNGEIPITTLKHDQNDIFMEKIIEINKESLCEPVIEKIENKEKENNGVSSKIEDIILPLRSEKNNQNYCINDKIINKETECKNLMETNIEIDKNCFKNPKIDLENTLLDKNENKTNVPIKSSTNVEEISNIKVPEKRVFRTMKPDPIHENSSKEIVIRTYVTMKPEPIQDNHTHKCNTELIERIDTSKTDSRVKAKIEENDKLSSGLPITRQGFCTKCLLF